MTTEETKKMCGTCRHFDPWTFYQNLRGDCQHPLPEVLEEHRGTLFVSANRGTRCPVWTPKEKKV